MSRSDALRGKDARHCRPTGAAFSATLASLFAMLAFAGPAAASSSPTIEREWVSGVTEHDAVLNAEINPNGLLTKYKLQIDTTGNFKFDQADTCPLHPPGIVCGQVAIEGEPLPEGLVEPPEGSIPAGSEGVRVSVDLASIGAVLQPSTTYHYRVIAANDATIVEGADQTFTTPPAKAPVIESESVSHITSTDAILEAQINPNGLRTTYKFYLDSGCLPPMACPSYEGYSLPSWELPATFEPQLARLDLNSAGVTLHPNVLYAYGVDATNAAGSVEGPEQRFLPPSASAPLIESQSVSHITSTDATLEATLDTEGLETTYEFQLRSPLCSPPAQCIPIISYPLPSGTLLGSFVGQSVSLDLNSAGVTLQPDKEYLYSVNATSAAGTTEGAVKTFTTPSEAGVEPLGEPGAGTDPQSSAVSPLQQAAPAARPRHHHRRHHRRGHRRNLHRLERVR